MGIVRSGRHVWLGELRKARRNSAVVVSRRTATLSCGSCLDFGFDCPAFLARLAYVDSGVHRCVYIVFRFAHRSLIDPFCYVLQMPREVRERHEDYKTMVPNIRRRFHGTYCSPECSFYVGVSNAHSGQDKPPSTYQGVQLKP